MPMQEQAVAEVGKIRQAAPALQIVRLPLPFHRTMNCAMALHGIANPQAYKHIGLSLGLNNYEQLKSGCIPSSTFSTHRPQ